MNKMNFPNSLIIWLTATLLAAALGGCTSNRASTKSQAPLYIGIAYDVSGSVNEIELPVLTVTEIDRIIAVLKAHGGTLTFGLIDENAFKPLLRLELDPIVGRLDERAQLNINQRKAISEFRTKVEAKMNRLRNATVTDINGSIDRFTLFFGEPTIPPSAQKVMIFYSDGIHTAPWRKLANNLPDEVTVFTVGMERSLVRKVFGEHAILFESIDPAIKALEVTSSNKGGD
jgi:hypothetical protein